MPTEPRSHDHPEQARLLAPLLRTQAGKVWAIDLGVAESEISRARSGQRAASIDDLAAMLVALRRLRGTEALISEFRRDLLLVLGLESEPEITAGDPISLVASVSEQATRSIRSILDTIADGRVEPHEAHRLRGDAAELRSLASRIDALASQGSLGAVLDRHLEGRGGVR